MREGLRLKLDRSARQNEHSLNSEIVGRLEGSFDEERKNLDYRAMLSVAAGGSENAKLMTMISAALHVATAGNPQTPEDLEAFWYSTAAIIAAHGGQAYQSFSVDELDGMPDAKKRGMLIAQTVLRMNDLPGVIDMPDPETRPWASKLGSGPMFSLAELGKVYSGK